jgi:hypothetical protein
MPRNILPPLLLLAVLGIGVYVAKVLLVPRIEARQSAGPRGDDSTRESSVARLPVAEGGQRTIAAEEQVARPPVPRLDLPRVPRSHTGKEGRVEPRLLAGSQPPAGQSAPAPMVRPSPAAGPEPPTPLAGAEGGSGEEDTVVSWSAQERLMRKYLEALDHLKD